MAADIKKHRHDLLYRDFSLYVDSIVQKADTNLRVNEIVLSIEKGKGLKRKCMVFSLSGESYVTHRDGAFIVYTFVRNKGLHFSDDIESLLVGFLEKSNITEEDKNKDTNVFNIVRLKDFMNEMLRKLLDGTNIDFYDSVLNVDDGNMFQDVNVTNDEKFITDVQPFTSEWTNEMVDNVIGNMFNQDDYKKIQTNSIELNYPDKINHASARPFVCHYKMCNRAFKRFEHLKRHYRIHTGERPFKCKFPGCHKAFARSDNLNQHLRVHNSESQMSVSNINLRNVRYNDEKS